MKALVLAVALMAPGWALAQSSTQMVAPNQNNTQDQTNMQRQPLNAHAVPNSGQADRIPTPTLNQPMTSDMQKPQVPSPAVR